MAVLATIPAAGLAVWLMLVASVAGAATQDASEHDVKAAFLYNFTRFVTWPDGIPANAEPFRLCIVADAAITRSVEQTMSGEMVNGRPAETLVPRSPAEAKACQMLFVGRAEKEREKALLAAVRDLPVLTIGESKGFLDGGGVIQFVLDHGRVRFDINVTSAERARLTISSRLLQAARRTKPRR